MLSRNLLEDQTLILTKLKLGSGQCSLLRSRFLDVTQARNASRARGVGSILAVLGVRLFILLQNGLKSSLRRYFFRALHLVRDSCLALAWFSPLFA